MDGEWGLGGGETFNVDLTKHLAMDNRRRNVLGSTRRCRRYSEWRSKVRERKMRIGSTSKRADCKPWHLPEPEPELCLHSSHVTIPKPRRYLRATNHESHLIEERFDSRLLVLDRFTSHTPLQTHQETTNVTRP